MSWTEKYRPTAIKDLVGQPRAKAILSKYVEQFHQGNADMPSLLFAGDAGTGKTSAFYALANELYGENRSANILDLNASDDRGIGVVRNSIKKFAFIMPTEAAFKIVFLDECDNMTKEAQAALRRVMEDPSNVCRFVLAANRPSKIIAPIRSRCAGIRFGKLDAETMTGVLLDICEEESIESEFEALAKLAEASDGDLRFAINQLQALAAMGPIEEALVESTFLTLPKTKGDELWNAIQNGTDVKKLDMELIRLLDSGFDSLSLLTDLLNRTVGCNWSDERKRKVIIEMARVEYYIHEGCDEKFQLRCLIEAMV